MPNPEPGPVKSRRNTGEYVLLFGLTHSGSKKYARWTGGPAATVAARSGRWMRLDGLSWPDRTDSIARAGRPPPRVEEPCRPHTVLCVSSSSRIHAARDQSLLGASSILTRAERNDRGPTFEDTAICMDDTIYSNDRRAPPLNATVINW